MLNDDYFLRTFRGELRNLEQKFITLNLHMLFHKSMTLVKALHLVEIYKCIQRNDKEDFRDGLSMIQRLLVFYPQLRPAIDKAMEHSLQFINQSNHKRLRLPIVRNLWKRLEITAWLRLIQVDEHFTQNKAMYRNRISNNCVSLTARKKKLGVR